jgi:hypothetical protein
MNCKRSSNPSSSFSFMCRTSSATCNLRLLSIANDDCAFFTSVSKTSRRHNAAKQIQRGISRCAKRRSGVARASGGGALRRRAQRLQHTHKKVHSQPTNPDGVIVPGASESLTRRVQPRRLTLGIPIHYSFLISHPFSANPHTNKHTHDCI